MTGRKWVAGAASIAWCAACLFGFYELTGVLKDRVSDYVLYVVAFVVVGIGMLGGKAIGLTVVLAEVGNGLEVRHQADGQPDQFGVALTLPLKAPARLDAIEVSVDVDLQQRRRMVGRPSRRLRLNAAETESSQIKLFDKDIDRPDRIVIAQVCMYSAGRPILQFAGTVDLATQNFKSLGTNKKTAARQKGAVIVSAITMNGDASKLSALLDAAMRNL